MKKTLCSLVAGISILGSLTGCGEWEEQHRKEVAAWNEKETKRLAEVERVASIEAGNIYSNSLIVANYSVPFVEITSKKTSFTLDIFEHAANAAKAQKFSLPVSEEYFDSVEVGKTLSSQFNSAAFLFDGDIEGYSNTLSEKKRSDLYLAVSKNAQREISPDLYRRVLALNGQSKDYAATTNKHSLILSRNGVDLAFEEDFIKSNKIVVETSKSNYTLDIFKHIENAMNSMKFPIEVPAYIGKKLKVGQKIDKNFVGASLLFSSSPSEVSYTVVEKK